MHAALPMLVWLCAGQLPAGTRTALTADQMEEDEQRHLAVAQGHVLLRSGTLVLHTDRLLYDVPSDTFEIPGPLFGIDGTTLITATRATGGLADGGSAVTLENVRIEEFQWLPPDLALRAGSAAEVRRQGRLVMAVDGKRLKQTGPSRYELDGVRVSPCACPETGTCRPDWALAATRADVHSGDYALLIAPELRISDLPVPLLRPPLLYVPLSHRRSGFLLPHFYWQAQNGFLIDEPYYLTLGESYDLTFSAGYITGATEIIPPAGSLIPIGGSGANGVHGPRASAEFRYAPVAGTTGRVLFTAIDDFNHDLDSNLVAEQRGFRGILHALQVQDVGSNDGDRFDLNLVSDARLTGQLTTDLLYSQIPATRSSAFAFHRSHDWDLTLDGAFLQDFQGDFAASNTHALLFGPGAPSTIARLPALTAQLAESSVGHTPLRFSFVGSLVRDGPLGSPYDSLSLGPAGLGPLCSGLQTSFTLAPCESVSRARVAMERLDLNPALSLPWAFGQFATARLSVAWRQDGWLFEDNPLPANLSGPSQGFSQAGTRGYPVMDLELGTQISRDFGSGDGRVKHSIAPQVELRSIPFQVMAGTVPPLWLIPPGGAIYDHATTLPIARVTPLPYDEIDTAAGLTQPRAGTFPGSLAAATAPGGISQGAIHLDQRLRTHAGEVLRLDVGENFDGAGFESTYATLSGRVGPFHGAGYLDWSDRPLPCPLCSGSERQVRRFTEAWAEAGVNDRRGDGLSLYFVRAIAAGGPQISAPLDLLFATSLASDDPRWALPDVSQLAASGNLRIIGGLGAHAGASYQLAASGLFSQVSAGLDYVSSQRCCNIDVNGVFQPTQPGGRLGFAAVFVLLDLGEFTGSTSH
jgi:LPS-assembly protein